MDFNKPRVRLTFTHHNQNENISSSSCKKLISFSYNQNQKRMAKLGGVREVEGTANSLEIDNLARFAVDEHNKKQNSMLQFGKVINAKQQVVSGTLHHITLEAVDGDHKKLFEAKVWEKPWMQFKELKEFNPVAHSSTT